MATHYTDEINVQVVISLLKQHGIRKVIASPGTTNKTFICSIQSDPFFEIYSSVDERSAAYIACGLAAESGEPVVICCTGATASRNYFPGLTEAYYRKLPILALTASRESSKIGHLDEQVTDRTAHLKDTVKYCAQIPIIKDDEDLWNCEIKVNTAILECSRNGGGPVHLNIETRYSQNYEATELPVYRKIDRIIINDTFPSLPKCKIAIYLGTHVNMTSSQVKAIESFCESNNAVVFCSHTSNYYGKYAINFSLAEIQPIDKSPYTPDVVIHIGEVREYSRNQLNINKEVWRVSPDGEVRDTYRKLRYVFDMPIEYFFKHYYSSTKSDNSYFQKCKSLLAEIRSNKLEIPFSNIWTASQLSPLIPTGSVIHFGILNSLRSWNLFELPQGVTSMSNVGGFGIDGGMSSLVGASLCNPDKLYYLVIGDLAFFYDLNVLGNRHIGPNVRILLINNGRGKEFSLHKSQQKDAIMFDEFVAAAGHFGNKSEMLVRDFAKNLSFEYLAASNKKSFNQVYEKFISPEPTEKPMIFEVFTDSTNETEAYDVIRNIKIDMSRKVTKKLRSVVGDKGINIVKSIIGK